MPEQLKPKEDSNQDVKPRGANRSTKVAGKLKVLPEQPETPPRLGPAKRPVFQRDEPLRDYTGSSGTTGDSDEGDVEENDESEEDEVGVSFIGEWGSIKNTKTFAQGVQSNITYSRRYSSKGRIEAHEEESKISAASHCLCHCEVMEGF